MLILFRVFFICCVGFSVAQASTEGSIDESSGITEYPDYNWDTTPLDCGPNEVNKCVGCPPEDYCYDRVLCEDAFSECTPTCVCKEGFIRKSLDRECIPINECGALCDGFEEYTECRQCRNEICSSIMNPVNCSGEEACTPGCVCWNGYYRVDRNSLCLYRSKPPDAKECMSW